MKVTLHIEAEDASELAPLLLALIDPASVADVIVGAVQGVLTREDVRQIVHEPGGTSRIEGSTPVIEHESGPDVSAGEPVVDGVGVSVTGIANIDRPGPFSVVHEEAQQVDGQLASPPAVNAPAAPLPEAVPAEPYTQKVHSDGRAPCADCGLPSSVGKERCASCAAKAAWTPERREAQRQRIATRRAAGREHFEPFIETSPKRSDEAQEPATFPIDEEAHREAAAVMDALLAPSTDAPVCDCPVWLRERATRFKAGEANEAHRAECSMYRKGAHYYPLAAQSNGDGVYASTCAWCGEKRDFSPYADATEEAKQTPTISAASAKTKQTVCPKCGGHFASLLHKTACLKTAKTTMPREPRHAGNRL